jgi:hypothetical protein
MALRQRGFNTLWFGSNPHKGLLRGISTSSGESTAITAVTHLRYFSTCNNFRTAFNEIVQHALVPELDEGTVEARGLFQKPTSG